MFLSHRPNVRLLQKKIRNLKDVHNMGIVKVHEPIFQIR